MTSEQDTITLTAHCLCKAHIFTTKISKSKLPLPAYACHCDSCRHMTGALYAIDTPWPGPHAEVDVSKLRVYNFSPSIEILFCSTCSTPMFFAHPQKPDLELGVFTGTIQNDAGDLIKIVDHIFVGDTKDGGATMWMRKPNADGTEAKRYKEQSTSKDRAVEEYPFDWPPYSALTGYEARKDESVSIRCKCKGVDFIWARGNYEGKKKEELPWFIDPVTHKALAGFCGCNSCRLSSGVDVWNWTFTELENLAFSDGSPFPKLTADLKPLVDAKGPLIGTLTYYASSPDVQRYFCSKCSACIFYAVDGRANMVDVAIGVLEASDGARAEGFLSWGFGGIVNNKDAEGGWRHGMLDKVVKECEEWRIARGYPTNWLKVAREEAAAKKQS